MAEQSAIAQKSYRGTMPIPVLMPDGTGQPVPVSQPNTVFAPTSNAAGAPENPGTVSSDPVLGSVDAAFKPVASLASAPTTDGAQSSSGGDSLEQPTSSGTDLEGGRDYTLQPNTPSPEPKRKFRIPGKLIAATAVLILLIGGFVAALILGVGRSDNPNTGNGADGQTSLFNLGTNQTLNINGKLSVSGASRVGDLTVGGNATVSGSITQGGNSVCDDSNNCGYLATGDTTSFSSLTLSTALGAGSGGTGSNTIGPAGSIAYSNGSAYNFTSAGTTNQLLTSGGSGTPTFQNIASLLTAGTNLSITGTTNATISTVANPTFATSVTTPELHLIGGNGNAILQVGIIGQDTTYILPDSGAATATICLDSGNCGASGGGGGGSVSSIGGTFGKIAKFTGAQAIADSTLSELGSVLTASGTLIAQGGTITLGTASQAGSVILNDGSSSTGTISLAALGQNTVYTIPDPGAGTATICISTGNCAGAGGGITGSGTTGTFAKFTGTGAIGNAILSESGSTLTDSGQLLIQGGTATLGTSSQLASLVLFDGSSNTLTLRPATLGQNTVVTLPDPGGVSDTVCLLSLANCVGGGGGGGSAPNGAAYITVGNNSTLSAERAITLNSTNLTGTDGGANGSYTINTIQDIAASSSPSFTNLTLSGDAAVNGGDITSTGALRITPSGALTVGAVGQTLTLQGTTSTITSNGAGNDITLSSADQVIIGSGGTIELQNGTNVTGNLDVSGTLTAATGNAFQVSSAGLVTYANGTTNTNTLVCRNASGQLAPCSASVLTGTAFIQGGNSFGAQAVLGTNDANSLAFRTNSGNKLVLDTSGNLQFLQASTLSTSTGNLTVRANGTSALTLGTSGAGTVNLGASSETTLNIGNVDSTTTVLGSVDLGSTSTSVVNIATGSLTSLNIGSSTTVIDIQSNNTNLNTVNGSTIIGNLNGAVSLLSPFYTLSASGNQETLGFINSPYGGLGSYNNLLLRSEAFDRSDWVKTNVSTPTADTILAPDGNTTAESLADTSAGGSVSQVTTTATSSDTYTFSVWLQSSGLQSVDLRIDGSTSGIGSEITPTVTSTWHRYSVSQSTVAFTGFVKVLIFPGTTGGSGTVRAWGAQLVKSSSVGVYARTTAATVAASNNSATPVTSGLQGLVSNGGAFINTQNAASVGLIVQGTSGQTADLVHFQNNSGTNLFAVDSVGVLTLGASSAVTSTQIATLARSSSFASALSLVIQPGGYAGVGGTGGSLTLQGGTESDAGGTGGAVNVIGGTGVVAGGAASLTGGTGTTTGGAATVTGGTGTTTGGLASLTGGTGSTTGGAANISGGTGTTTGGSVSIDAGSGATIGNILIGTNTNAPGITIGSTTGTGTITLGQSVNTNTINIGSAALGNVKTQTINIGTQAGLNGNSNSIISIGSNNQSSSMSLLVGAGGFGLDGVAASTYTIGASTTTGNILIGGIAQSTGALTLGRSTATNTLTIASSAGSGSTQTINLGTSATSGSTTNINIGSTIAGLTTLQSAGGTALTTLGTANTSTILCRNSSNIIATCSGSLTGSAFVQGGNSFGATGVLGTNDSNDLNIRANGTDRIILTSTGNVSVQAAAAGTISLGTTNANTITIGSTNASTVTTILGGGGINIGTGAASTIQIGSTTNAIAQTIGIGNNATASSTDTIQIGNLLTTSTTNIQGGTGTSAVTIKAGAGGTIGIGNDNTITQRVLIGSTEASSVVSLSAGANINIGVNDGSTINIGAVGNFAHTIAIGTPSGSAQTITIGSTNASSTTTIRGFNGITLGTATQTGTITLGQSTQSHTINIGAATIATGQTQLINIGTSATGTGDSIITIGNTNGNSELDLRGGLGGIDLTTGSGDISISAGATLILNGGGPVTIESSGLNIQIGVAIAGTVTQIGNTSGATAVNLQAGSGGITLTGNTTIASGSNLTVAGGATSLTGPAAGSSDTLSITTGVASNRGIFIQAAGSQTANLFEAKDSGGLTLFRVGSAGALAVANNNSSIGGLTQISGQQLTLYSGSGGNVALAVRPNSGVTQTADLVQIQDSTGAVLDTIDKSGKLGIGTTSPQSKLQINGGTADATAQLFINTSADANRGLVVQQFSATQSEALIQFQNSSGTGFSSIDPAGKFFAPNGLSTAPGFAFFSDSDTGMYRAAANELGLVTGAAERLRINSTGNVGIGDTSPASLFTVGSGDLFQVNSSGTITAVVGITTSGNILPNAAGTIDLGSTSAEFNNLYVGDNGGLVLGLSQNATLAYDAATDNRVELTGSGASLFIEDKLSFGAQTLTLTDDGTANDALTPSATYVRVDVDETANGGVPDLTISETGAKDGQLLIITNNEQDASEDTFTISNSAGVVQLPGGSTLTLGPNDSVTLLYMNDRWVTLSNSNN